MLLRTFHSFAVFALAFLLLHNFAIISAIVIIFALAGVKFTATYEIKSYRYVCNSCGYIEEWVAPRHLKRVASGMKRLNADYDEIGEELRKENRESRFGGIAIFILAMTLGAILMIALMIFSIAANH